MRLRTELVTEVPYERPFHHVEGTDDEMAHDAAAAHALVKALTEHFTDLNWNYVQGNDDVSRRATEIMASWGYVED